jgi:hypothetical protein
MKAVSATSATVTPRARSTRYHEMELARLIAIGNSRLAVLPSAKL